MIIGILFVVITFIVILSVGSSPTVSKTSAPKPTLANYENSTSSVSFTTYGSLVSNAQRTTVTITVSASDVNLSIYSGYQKTIINHEDFANNQTAYNYLLSNLDSQGFLSAKTTKLNEASACPSGETYELVLTDNSKTISSLWDDNCNSGVDGTFYGNGQSSIGAIQTLFQNQVTNYSDFTSSYTF